MPLPYPGMGKPTPPDLAAQLKIEAERRQPQRFTPEMAAQLYQLLRSNEPLPAPRPPQNLPPTLLENHNPEEDSIELLGLAEPPDGTPPRRPRAMNRTPWVTTPKIDPNAPLIY